MEKLKQGYKQTDIGVIPEDWKEGKIRNFCSMKSGNSITSESISERGEFPCYGGNGLRGYTNKFTHSGKYTLVGRQGALCGNVNYINSKFFASEHAIVTTPFSYSDALFLAYAFERMNLNQYTESSAQPGLSVNKVLELPFGCPPTLTEQTAIATALSDLDALIAAFDKKITKKQHIKQGAMQQLLTGKKRLPEFNGEWVEKKLGEIAEIKDGTHQTPHYVNDGMPFYSVESVTNNDFKKVKTISLEEHKLLTKTFKIEKGDVLMTRIGSIGVCKFVDWELDASFYVSLALLKFKQEFSAQYFTQYSKTSEFNKEIEEHSLQHATPKKINLGKISLVKIRIPLSFAEQTAIAQVLTDMDNEITQLEADRNKYEQIKAGMMQQLLTGKIRLVN